MNEQSDPMELLTYMLVSQHENNGNEPLQNVFRVRNDITTACAGEGCSNSTVRTEFYSSYEVPLPDTAGIRKSSRFTYDVELGSNNDDGTPKYT
jgi:hypothetical protein